MNWSKISTIIGLLVVLIGGTIAIEDRYAKAEEVVDVRKRLDIKINEDRSSRIQERIWRIEDRYLLATQAPMPPEVKNELRALEIEKKNIDNYIQNTINSLKVK
jgi:hypothetical protein